MPLQQQSQEIPFRFGIDRGDHPEATPKGFDELENCDWDQDGALLRRKGFRASAEDYPADHIGEAPQAFVRAGANRYGVLTDSTLAWDSRSTATLSPGQNVVQSTAAQTADGKYTLVATTHNREADLNVELTSNLNHRVRLFIVENLSGRTIAEYDLFDGTFDQQNAQVVYTCPAVQETLGDPYIWVVYYVHRSVATPNSGTRTVMAVKVELPHSGIPLPTLPAPTTIQVCNAYNEVTRCPYAAVGAPDIQASWVVVVRGTNDLWLAQIAQDLTVSAVTTIPATLAGDEVFTIVNRPDITSMPAGPGVIYPTGSGLAYRQFDRNDLTNFTGLLSPGTVTSLNVFTAAEYDPDHEELLILGSTASSSRVWWVHGASFDSHVTILDTIVIATQAAHFSVTDAAPGRYTDGVVGAGFTIPFSSFPFVKVLGFTPDYTIAPLTIGQLGYDEVPPTVGKLPLPNWTGPDDELQIPIRVSLETKAAAQKNDADIIIARVRLTTLAHGAARQPVITAYLQGQGFYTGAVLGKFDGARFTPAAFLSPAAYPTLTPIASGLLTGAYSYQVVYEYIDVQGNIHLSPPSAAQQITLTAQNCQVSFTVAALEFYDPRFPTIRAKIYRNTVDPITHVPGSTFYLVHTQVVWASDIDGLDNTVSFVDGVGDTALSTAEEIYTTGGVVESALAPPLSFIASHRNRLVGIRADMPETILFTGETFEPNAPKWNPEFSLRVDNQGGPPLALASLNDKLIILQHDHVSAVYGEGPDALGNGSFSMPEILSRGIGVEPDQIGSVVEVPQGVAFAHRTGIHLLQSDMSLLPIGQALGGKTWGLEHPIHRARYLPSRSQIWFFASDAVYIFDCRFSRWTKFTSTWDPWTDVIDINGRILLISSHRAVGSEYRILEFSNPDIGSSEYVDDEIGLDLQNFYSQTMGLPWFRMDRGQDLRLMRVFLTGSQDASRSAAELQLEVFTQDERRAKPSDLPDATYYLSADRIYSEPAHWFWRVRAISQRCRAFRCRLTIVPDPLRSTATFYAIPAITYEYGVLGGRGKHLAVRGAPPAP